MALTPEDVVNKRFQPTKFREGYDQDEVDDFLDEVVVELRRLNQENEELRQRLIASDSKISELQRTPAQPAPAPAAFEQPVAASAPAPFQPAAAVVPVSDPNADPGNTNNLLQLARRLHEEHVREGVEKRDALVADGQAQAQRAVDEAQTQAQRAVEEAQTQAQRAVEEAQAEAQRALEEGQTQAARAIEDGTAQAARIVEEAQTTTRNQIATLDQERAALEQRVEELRNFERDYRAKLKSYIEGQLQELDSSSAALVGAGAPAAVPAAQNFAAQQIAPPPANYPGFAGN